MEASQHECISAFPHANLRNRNAKGNMSSFPRVAQKNVDGRGGGGGELTQAAELRISSFSSSNDWPTTQIYPTSFTCAPHSPMEHRHSRVRQMNTSRRRRRQCCFVGAFIFFAWGSVTSGSAVTAAFGFGGGLSQQRLSRSLRWVGGGSGKVSPSSRRRRVARTRSRAPSRPADGALSSTSRRRSAFVVEGGAGPAAASTTQDWKDLTIEVGAA